MSRSSSSLNFLFRATGNLRGGMTTGESESSTSMCNVPSTLPSPLKMSAKSVNTCSLVRELIWKVVKASLLLTSGGGVRPQDDLFVSLHELLLMVCSYHLLQRTRRYTSLSSSCRFKCWDLLLVVGCQSLVCFLDLCSSWKIFLWKNIARCTRVNLHSYGFPSRYLHNSIDFVRKISHDVLTEFRTSLSSLKVKIKFTYV